MARWVRAFLATGLIAAISISGPQAAEKKEQSPADMDTIADMVKIPAILERRGYSTEDIAGIMHGNWIGLLRRSWE